MAAEGTKADWIEVLDYTIAAVFESMLAVGVEPIDGMRWADGDDRITAAVKVCGSWTGVLALEAPRDLACLLAKRYLSVESLDRVADAGDVLGELANMICGNLKSALCPGAALSSPSIVESSHLRLGLDVGESRAYQCGDGLLWVFRGDDRSICIPLRALKSGASIEDRED